MIWQWKKEMIYFMENAVEESKYYALLANRLRPYIKKTDSCCDVGCGLGQLSLELSPHVKKISSWDINPDALESLRKNRDRQGIQNIYIKQTDAFEEEGEIFDVMIFSMFGQEEDIIKIASGQCKRLVLVIQRLNDRHQFSLTREKKWPRMHEGLYQRLLEREIPFESQDFTLSFDQPFKNLEEAVCFFRLYGRTDRIEQIDQDFALTRVIKQNNELYPYLLPNSRHLRLIAIESCYMEKLLEY